MYDTLCNKQMTNDLFEDVNEVLADNFNKSLHMRRFLNDDFKNDDTMKHYSRRNMPNNNMPKTCVTLNMEIYSSDIFNKTLIAATKIIHRSIKKLNIVVALLDVSSMSILNVKFLNNSKI